MYLRTKTFKNKDGSTRTYLFIVKGVKLKGKKKQITVANLGRLDLITESGKLDNLAEKLAKFCHRIEIFDITKDLSSNWSKEYGPLLIFRKIWEMLGLAKFFSDHSQKTEHKFNLSEAIFCLVCNRLISPASELGIYSWKQNVYEPLWDNLELHHFYRALDFLVEQKEYLEFDLFEKIKDLFSQELDLVMFDTTTIKYWGKGEKAPILQHGFSKERRGDLKQLIVGILMTKDGTPIGHQVWPGNTSDLKAFEQIISETKKKFRLKRIIFVCDRGMISEKILDKLNQEKLEYILGVRMRQLDENTRNTLLKEEGFEKVSKSLSVKEVKSSEGRYIVCYNSDAARFEQKKREYFKKILEQKLEFRTLKDWVVKNGYRKYITFEGEGEFVLDETKLEKESIYDGKYILLTNTDLPSKDVSSYYRGLWQIEACFRSLKSELEAGPIYHYTEKRIKAHIFVCFLGLLLQHKLQTLLYELNPEVVYSEVLFDLKKLKAQHFQIKDKAVILRTELQGKSYESFRAVGLSPPNRILNITNLKDE